MDKAAIFETVTRRNALRRENGLPALDLRAEFDRSVALTRWKEYAAVELAHVPQRREIAEAVLAEYRAERALGWGASVGGQWVVEAVTQRRFEAWLAAKGYIKPPHPGRGLVRYGAPQPG